MTVGVEGSSFEAGLARMVPMLGAAAPIGAPEPRRRVEKARRLMRAQGMEALYLDASTNSADFTGIGLKPAERLHGAVTPADGWFLKALR